MKISPPFLVSLFQSLSLMYEFYRSYSWTGFGIYFFYIMDTGIEIVGYFGYGVFSRKIFGFWVVG